MATPTTPTGGAAATVYDFHLRNLQQPAVDNVAGLETLWYTEASNILNWPERGALVIPQLELLDGAVWYQLVSVRGSVRYKGTNKDEGRQGTGHVHKLTGALARHSDGLAAGLESLEQRQLVVLYRDLNGLCQLVGTPEEPLTFRDTYDSGAEPFGQRNGYDWSLDGASRRRARPYAGTWQVSGLGLQDAVQLGAGSGGTVQIIRPDGRVMATVPAGRTLVISSGFRVAYRIQ